MFQIKASGVFQPEVYTRKEMDVALSVADTLAENGEHVQIVEVETDKVIEEISPVDVGELDFPEHDPSEIDAAERDFVSAYAGGESWSWDDEEN